jgi:hypothetical protein
MGAIQQFEGHSGGCVIRIIGDVEGRIGAVRIDLWVKQGLCPCPQLLLLVIGDIFRDRREFLRFLQK